MPSTSQEDPQAWKEQVIVIQAYYDAMSVVPARAPGAENASGIVALLKLIETLRAHRPNYSVLFLATSGHFQGLEGIMISSIVTAGEASISESGCRKDRIDFDLMLSLDLSSHGQRSVTFGTGHLLQSGVADG